MIIMILQKVPVSLRGELTRWLIEADRGIYVGHVSALVRDKLWEKCCKGVKAGRVFQAWNTNNEQHFEMRMYGGGSRRVVDWEGVLLVEEIGTKITPAQKKRIGRA